MSLSRGTSQMRTGFVLLTSSLTPPVVFLHYPFPHPWQCPMKMVLVCVGEWGARSKAVVQISAEKLSPRKKEFQVAWDDFYRNSGISLSFLYLSFGSAIIQLWGCSVYYSYEMKLYPKKLLKMNFCTWILLSNREFWHLKCWFPLPWPRKAVWGELLAKSYSLGQWNQWEFL